MGAEAIPIELESEEETKFIKRGCCFWMPCIRTSEYDRWEADDSDHWWANGLEAFKKVKEWTEVVAGPKWKTFIRRFNKNRMPIKQGSFHYDPLSYALNFDEGGGGQNGNFISRFASVPKDSGKDGPTIG